ncbi:hypothetical protein [Spirosoma sp. KNUC1025]|uniref:hypothetical protein n=1 Tax=Spirosoma sp. KNUC1025 TaxID=2894082 RepID=UPI00386D4608|nr:hypothetical protein LN737_00675 [Spirosoma sp. KNUC1025]
MFYSSLRKAIAHAFPGRYHWHSWRKLLPDFVDLKLNILTIKWSNYQRFKDTNSPIEEPKMEPIVEQATAQLAKSQRLSYKFLAQHYFVQLHQIDSLTAEVKQLKELHKTSLSNLFSRQTPNAKADPRYTLLLTSILNQLMGTTKVDSQLDNQTMLSAFIETQYEAYQQQLAAYEEEWADYGDPTRSHNPPQPPDELVAAVVMQALEKGQPYEELAYLVFSLQQDIKNMQHANDFQSELIMKFKNASQTNYKAARMYEQGITLDNRRN